MQRVGSARTRAVLLLAASAAAAPILAATPAFAGVTLRNIKAAQTAPSLGANLTSSAAPVTAYPVQYPINGFRPFVAFGLSDENENDFFSPKSVTPGQPDPEDFPSPWAPVPNPPRYFVATLDTGSSATIIGHEDAEAINLFANGLEGSNSIEVFGSSGSEFLDVSDALGLYISGLANATPSANGPVVPQSSLKGMWNTSILTTREGSVIPSLIGGPMAAHWQFRISNSQTQRLTVDGQTYQGPHVELRDINTPHDNTFVRATLTPASPGGANSTAAFTPDFFGGISNLSDNPLGPTFWNALMADVNLKHDALADPITRSFLFDTGAQVTVISTDTATDLGIDTGGGNPTPHDFTVEVLGVGGIRTVKGYFIDQFSIVTDGVDLDATNVPVLILDLEDPSGQEGTLPGIIGMSLFNDRDLIINGKTGTGSYLAFSEFAIEAKWTANAGGNWGDNSNWLRGVPSDLEAPANFTNSTAAPQTINVEADYTFGSLTFDNAGRYTISGPGTLRLEQIVGGATIQVNSGSHTVAAPVELASDTTIAVLPAASVLTISNDLTSPNASGVTKTGQGTVELKNLRNIGALDIQAGKVKMLGSGGGGGGADRTSNIDTLAIAAAAQLDLSDNNLVIRSGDAGSWDGEKYSGVQRLVQLGRNDTEWNGPGGIVTSTPAAASGLTSLGVATADSLLTFPAKGTALWSGQTVAADDVLVMYTYAGDANLDGFISGDDYTAIDFAINTAGADGWINGDFNYDGFISGDDYTIIDFNIVAQGAPFPTGGSGASGLSAVPEPTACGFAILAAPLLLRRRRQPRVY